MGGKNHKFICTTYLNSRSLQEPFLVFPSLAVNCVAIEGADELPYHLQGPFRCGTNPMPISSTQYNPVTSRKEGHAVQTSQAFGKHCAKHFSTAQVKNREAGGVNLALHAQVVLLLWQTDH